MGRGEQWFDIYVMYGEVDAMTISRAEAKVFSYNMNSARCC